MDKEKHVDESWKETVADEKTLTGESAQDHSPAPAQDQNEIEVNFLNYVTSLVLQSMIFLGEIPNPMADNKIERNGRQAKFLIDTLILLRDKTKGNLSKEEEDLLNSSIYELQLKYVENSNKERASS